jgi:hypothetical protein
MTSFEFSNSPIEAYSAEQPALAYPTPQVEPEPMQVAEPVPSPAPENGIDLSKYSFYVEKAQMVNDYTNQQSTEIFIDLDIMVTCEANSTRVSKRIKMYKDHLAREAAIKDSITKATATYVESKQEKGPSPMTQRLIELSGINHPLNYVKK